MSVHPKSRAYRGWWSLAGAGVAILGFAWIVQRLDFAELQATLARGDPLLLVIVPLAVMAEQLVRAWKWRQILHSLRPVGTLRLFGAIMAGYLANLLVPLGLSPLVRSWLVARLEALTMSSVLASVAIDRLVDGIVFAALVLFVVAFAVFPDPGGDIQFGLVVGASGSAAAVVTALALLWRHKRASTRGVGWVLRTADRLPRRFVARARSLAISFAEGIVWPAEPWRGAAIVGASILIKIIAASHLFWAGLAFGIQLEPFAYLVMLAILGFIVILAHVARVPGGFIIGAVFALGLFGVGEERAVAMVTVVFTSSMLAIGVVGAFTLWRHGVILGELSARRVPNDGPP